MITESNYKEAYDKQEAYENAIYEHNEEFLSKYTEEDRKDFREMMYDCSIIGKIEIVEKIEGIRQDENYGIFKDIFVEQWCTNMEGDSYNGFVFATVGDIFIKVPFSC